MHPSGDPFHVTVVIVVVTSSRILWYTGLVQGLLRDIEQTMLALRWGRVEQSTVVEIIRRFRKVLESKTGGWK